MNRCTHSKLIAYFHYDKIGKAVQEVEKSLEKLQNGNKVEKLFVRKVSLKRHCKALEELIGEKFNLPDEVKLKFHFGNVYSRCNAILQKTHETEMHSPEIGEIEQAAEKVVNSIELRKIEDLKELLQRIKQMVESANHPSEARKLLQEAQEKLKMETVDNLIQTYHDIGKANSKVENTLRECKQLYHHEDNKPPIQIKYFVELTKLVENLRRI